MQIVRTLEANSIHCEVTKYRYDAISVVATVPGERWEIDVTEDGQVAFERFVSAGDVTGADELNEAIAKWAEPPTEAAE